MHPVLVKTIADQLLAERLSDAERLRLARCQQPALIAGCAHIPPELIDRLIELYCDWRAECEQVRSAYGRCSGSAGSDRARAFAAYTEALDREECTCELYAAQIRLVGACVDRSRAARMARNRRSRLRRVIGRLRGDGPAVARR